MLSKTVELGPLGVLSHAHARVAILMPTFTLAPAPPSNYLRDMAERGRPSAYTPELADRILDRLKTGMTLNQVCRENDDFPESPTVRNWAIKNIEGFSSRYAEAREIGYLSMADDCLDIADDATNDWVRRHNERTGQSEDVFNAEHYQRSRLRLDTRKWLLSKCLPKIYGDKLALGGPDGGPLQVVVQKFTEGDT